MTRAEFSAYLRSDHWRKPNRNPPPDPDPTDPGDPPVTDSLAAYLADPFARARWRNRQPQAAAADPERDAPVAADDAPSPKTDVENVIDALDRRVVPRRDIDRLGRALDRAKAPQAGRAGDDEAVNRAFGRATQGWRP